MAISLTAVGIDLTPFVAAWGKIEQVKSILLAQATMFTSQMKFELVNFRGMGATGGAAGTGLFAGAKWYDQPLEVRIDGVLAFEGLVRNIAPNVGRGTFAITAENILRRAAETPASLTATRINPAAAALQIIRQAVPDSRIDSAGFLAATASVRGAVVDLAIDPSSSQTVLQAIQKIQELASLSVFTEGSLITCRGFAPYQGSDSGLKFEIRDEFVREWGPFEYDYVNFNNRVRVGYTGGAEVVLDDAESQRDNDVVREFAFSATDAVRASDADSARQLGALYLARAAFRRRKVTIAGGRELAGVGLGDRFPVTRIQSVGASRVPMEAIEVRRTLDSNETELVLAELTPA